MNNEQFTKLKEFANTSDRIYVSVLNQEDRTLAYGYTCDRNTWHLYLKDGIIHKVVYDFHDKVLRHKQYPDFIAVSEASPDKRLYPETCDYEFCCLMIMNGGYLPFTTWTDNREEQQYYGLIVEQK